jgi:hypothetical protein
MAWCEGWSYYTRHGAFPTSDISVDVPDDWSDFALPSRVNHRPRGAVVERPQEPADESFWEKVGILCDDFFEALDDFSTWVFWGLVKAILWLIGLGVGALVLVLVVLILIGAIQANLPRPPAVNDTHAAGSEQPSTRPRQDPGSSHTPGLSADTRRPISSHK